MPKLNKNFEIIIPNNLRYKLDIYKNGEVFLIFNNPDVVLDTTKKWRKCLGKAKIKNGKILLNDLQCKILNLSPETNYTVFLDTSSQKLAFRKIVFIPENR